MEVWFDRWVEETTISNSSKPKMSGKKESVSSKGVLVRWFRAKEAVSSSEARIKHRRVAEEEYSSPPPHLLLLHAHGAPAQQHQDVDDSTTPPRFYSSPHHRYGRACEQHGGHGRLHDFFFFFIEGGGHGCGAAAAPAPEADDADNGALVPQQPPARRQPGPRGACHDATARGDALLPIVCLDAATGSDDDSTSTSTSSKVANNVNSPHHRRAPAAATLVGPRTAASRWGPTGRSSLRPWTTCSSPGRPSTAVPPPPPPPPSRSSWCCRGRRRM